MSPVISSLYVFIHDTDLELLQRVREHTMTLERVSERRASELLNEGVINLIVTESQRVALAWKQS